MRALGVDPSTVNTGIIVLEANRGENRTVLLEEQLRPKNKKGGWTWSFVNEVASRIVDLNREFGIDRVVIEGYGLNMKNASSVIPLVSLGATIRNVMQLSGIQWLEPTPGELKKFATGFGNTKKDQMMMKVLSKWGHESKSNDTADAYALAALGLAFSNHLGKLASYQTEVLGLQRLYGPKPLGN